MSPGELKKILGQHSLWLANASSGRRAFLSHADLSHADLGRAFLSHADLRDADLRDANLSGANLSGARVDHCSNVLMTTLGNYSVYAYVDCSGFRITAGCRRSLTLSEALTHWSPANLLEWTIQESEYGERMTRAVRFLAAEARLLGWNVPEGEEQ